MSIRSMKDRLARQHERTRQQRDIAKAMATAPTAASREELLSLLSSAR